MLSDRLQSVQAQARNCGTLYWAWRVSILVWEAESPQANYRISRFGTDGHAALSFLFYQDSVREQGVYTESSLMAMRLLNVRELAC
jgi:hypothetical protein